MSKDKAFMQISREVPERRPVSERVLDWNEIYKPIPEELIQEQSSRCMDCGTPFCHGYGCPLENLVPEWNELVYQGKWKEAARRLDRTAPFPEFTGRLCPALCESACTVGLGFESVSIRYAELTIIEKAFKEGWIVPKPPVSRTGKEIAVIGAGPAGLAAADKANVLGHSVTVYDRFPAPGGLLRFGIPDFKLEKHIIDRRITLLEEEGIVFSNEAEVGEDITIKYLQKKYDAVILAIGCWVPRDIPIPGRDLKGIHFALDYLIQQNRINTGEAVPESERITAEGKRVVIVGGGDTGADCIGTAVRQGAEDILQIEILPKPPADRPETMPWPTHPRLYKQSASHEEGGKQKWSVLTKEFSGSDGHVTSIAAAESVFEDGKISEKKGTDFTINADLVVLATGFVHPEHNGIVDPMGLEKDARGNILIDENFMTSADGVFAAGDASRGPSLVVHAIRGGIDAAAGADKFLKK